MKNCRYSAFSLCGLEARLPPFSCRFSQNVTTCLSKEFIPAIPFGNFNHPVPTRSLRLLRVAAGSTRFASWLHPAHPIVAAAKRKLSLAQKQRVGSRSCGLQELLQYSDCALSCAMWLLQTVESELLASVGWKRGCQPFSCPCLQNVMHCRMEIYETCWLVSGIHSSYSLMQRHSTHERSESR